MIQEAIGRIQDEMESDLNYIYPLRGNREEGVMPAPTIYTEKVNPDLDHKVRKVTDKFSENINIIANEPSLAFYRIEEHVRKSQPLLVERKQEVQDIQRQVQGASFDTEYAINAVNNMKRSTVHFRNIQDLLKNALFMKQQLIYEETRRQQERSKPGMYSRANKGGMIRTNTVDLPFGTDRASEFGRSVQLQNPPGSSPQRVRSSSLSHPPKSSTSSDKSS